MATYRPGITSAALGGLLRLAQEEKQNQPHLIPPSAQSESPIRQQIQAPIVSPEAAGSEKTVALKGELTPSSEIPTTGSAPSVIAPTIPQAPSSVVGPGGGSVPGAETPTSVGGSTPGSVLGAKTASLPSTLLPSALRGSSMALSGRMQATPVPQVNVAVPSGRESFGSEQAFQEAQTPTQNILGGIGKVGTNVTTKLKLPQLIPGGVFKKLQDIMAPTINRLMPNFNWNKG